MGKRKLSPTPDESHDASRRSHVDKDVANGYEIKARIDPKTGQQSAFPGLDGITESDDNDEIFYGPAQDGLEYLRMVRAEAAQVPKLLQTNDAQPSDLKFGTDLDLAGFWSGEAMVAPPREHYEDGTWMESDNDIEHSSSEPREPQDAYYDALISRFVLLRERLGDMTVQEGDRATSDPTIRTKTNVDPSPVVSLSASQSAWYKAFSYSIPTPRFIASLPQSSVVVALERLEILLTKRNMQNPARRQSLGAWSWSLLARCREVGQLSGEEISVLRSLAKTALSVGRKLRAVPAGLHPSIQPSAVDSEDAIEIEETDWQDADGSTTPPAAQEGVSADDEAELAQARERLLAMMSSSDSEATGKEVEPMDKDELQPAFMALDSIVTIVGRLFGQRDLLMQRPAW